MPNFFNTKDVESKISLCSIIVSFTDMSPVYVINVFRYVALYFDNSRKYSENYIDLRNY
jgi:hypothetical protein